MSAQSPDSVATQEDFVTAFGGIYEHSPWVAERVWDKRRELPLQTFEDLAKAMAAEVDAADYTEQIALIRSHPDLAGRAAMAGELTTESTTEQGSAGIDQCSPAEYQQFQLLNDAYWEKFAFPFVMAVRNSNRTEILTAFERRLLNDVDEEFHTALQQIHEIARLRLGAMAQNA